MLIPKENNNILDNFGPYKDKKLALKKYIIKKNNINLIGKSLDNKSYTRDILLKYTL